MSKNPITGDTIATRPYSDQYGEGYSGIDWSKTVCQKCKGKGSYMAPMSPSLWVNKPCECTKTSN